MSLALSVEEIAGLAATLTLGQQHLLMNGEPDERLTSRALINYRLVTAQGQLTILGQAVSAMLEEGMRQGIPSHVPWTYRGVLIPQSIRAGWERNPRSVGWQEGVQAAQAAGVISA